MSDTSQPRWAFEDMVPGSSIILPGRVVTAEEIIEFAEEFDPQPMHLDAAAGEASMLGGLSASGFHVAGIMMRIVCDHFLLDSTSQGSPGLEFLNWKKPVLAGDRLVVTVNVLEARRSRSRPDLGLVRIENLVINQRDEVVSEVRNTGMFRLRNPEVPYED